MDKKQKKGGSTMNQRANLSMTLREENTGTKNLDVNSMFRMEHLQKLATWAGVEAGISPLGALFGRRLAACAEVKGVPLDTSIFTCHRCESVLQPGFNCTIRIEGNKKKVKRRKKQHIVTKNSVVYTCHFCSHSNRMMGTQRGYVKGLLTSRQRPVANSEIQRSSENMTINHDEQSSNNKHLHESVCQQVSAVIATNENSLEKSPLTPLERESNSSSKKRKASGSTKMLSVGADSSSAANGAGSSRRKRKGWSSLKEIAANNEAQSRQSISNFAIPFIL